MTARTPARRGAGQEPLPWYIVEKRNAVVLQHRTTDLAQGPTLMSGQDPRHPEDRPSFRVGADLRAARERIGWELPAMAEHLRIRLPYLEALEAGRLGDLPGVAYAVGFLRTYARALGLDPDEMARRYRAEAADLNRKPQLDFPAPVPERGVPAGAVILVGALLAVGAYVGWYRLSGETTHAPAPVAQVPERLLPPVPPAPAPAPPTQLASVPPPAAPVRPEEVAPPPPVVAHVPANPLSAQAAPVVPPPPDGTRIVLRARADSWIQVRDRQGPVLLNRVLRAGETWPVPAAPAGRQVALLLTTGNAGGTELLVDGQLTPGLGADGAVRRDLPLDADQIRDGKLAAPTAKPPPPR